MRSAKDETQKRLQGALPERRSEGEAPLPLTYKTASTFGQHSSALRMCCFTWAPTAFVDVPPMHHVAYVARYHSCCSMWAHVHYEAENMENSGRNVEIVSREQACHSSYMFS